MKLANLLCFCGKQAGLLVEMFCSISESRTKKTRFWRISGCDCYSIISHSIFRNPRKKENYAEFIKIYHVKFALKSSTEMIKLIPPKQCASSKAVYHNYHRMHGKSNANDISHYRHRSSYRPN